MKGVLIIAHGSRQKSTEQTLEKIVALAKEKLPDLPVETAYMEFGLPDIPDGLDRLAAAGVTEATAVPYFLFDGIHIREDIPEALEKYRQDRPGMAITLGRPLGEDPRLADVLADRIREWL